MKWCKATVFFALLVLFSASFLGNSSVATAGTEPSPFTPWINQLGAAQNILVSAGSRIVKGMDNPPNPEVPSPDLTGALNRLEAINNQLVSVDDMVVSLVEEVMGVEPSPFVPLTDIVPALAGVQNAAQAIVDEIEARMGTEPSPFVPAYEDGLRIVQNSAQTISTHTQNYIDQINCDVNCLEIESPAECESYVCCVWIPSDVPELGYCDIDPEYQPGL